MQQNYRNTRYNVPWDSSSRYKRYTNQEKKYIKQCIENNISSVEIAQILKRGLWAIEVQIMYIKNNNSNHNNNHNLSITNNCSSTKQQRQYFHKQKTRKQSQKQEYFMKRENSTANTYSNVKKSSEVNRKFHCSEAQKIIKTDSTLIQNHLSELMGL